MTPMKFFHRFNQYDHYTQIHGCKYIEVFAHSCQISIFKMNLIFGISLESETRKY